MQPMTDRNLFPDWPDAAASRRNFERAASTAGSVDALAREVERRMLERLQFVRLNPARVIDLGCGHGKGVGLLRERYAKAHVVGIDAAHSMLAMAQGRVAAPRRLLDRITGRASGWVCGDFEHIPFAAGSFGLAWSNLAFSWAEDPPALFQELHRVMRSGGLLMFSTYGPDTLRELRRAFAAADSHPHTHRFVDMHDLGDMLVASGFATPVMDMEELTLTFENFEALARDLRLSGQSNATRGRSRALLGRRAYTRMREAYESARHEGRLPSTVEIIYGHAWRGEPRVTKDGRSVIQLEFADRGKRREG